MVQAKLAPRPRIEDQTRWRILAAAAERFANQGYAATSIRDIAREVGVTVGAIYVHFPSKGRLLVAVSEEGIGRIGRAVDAAIAGVDDPWERLAAAMRAHLEVLLSNAAFARVIVRVTPAEVPEAARDLRAAARWLRGSLPAPDRRARCGARHRPHAAAADAARRAQSHADLAQARRRSRRCGRARTPVRRPRCGTAPPSRNKLSE